MRAGSRRDLFLGRLFRKAPAGADASDSRSTDPRACESTSTSLDPKASTSTGTGANAKSNEDAGGNENARERLVVRAGASEPPDITTVPLPFFPPNPARMPPPSPALSRLGAARPARAGTFKIQENLCLAWQNVGCSTCRERCPVPGAIHVDAARPTIVAATCTGCGDCVAICPAPILAIRFVPSPQGPKVAAG